MRAFQPISRPLEPTVPQPHWTAFWRIVTGVLLADIAFQVAFLGWIFFSLSRAEHDPNSVVLPHFSILPSIVSTIFMVSVLPWIAARPAKPKLRHFPDPTLSIYPR